MSFDRESVRIDVHASACVDAAVCSCNACVLVHIISSLGPLTIVRVKCCACASNVVAYVHIHIKRLTMSMA